MQKTRDRPKKAKRKKSFSLKKVFDAFKKEVKEIFKPKRAKAPKAEKSKAKKLSFKESFNKFKSEFKQAFTFNLPKPQNSPGDSKKQNGTKSGKVDPMKAVSGVLVTLAVIAVVSLIGGIGGGTKTVIKYIEPDIVEDDSGVAFDTDYTVYFLDVDKTLYAAAGINKGEAVTEPTHPDIVGLYFIGWSDTESGENIVSFPYAPTGDITLYPIYTDVQVLGFTGLTNSSGELTWTDDIASASAYTLSETGVYTYVTSPLDEMFPFCEIEEFTDSHGNVFVKYPKCYIKYVTNAEGVIDGFKVSNVQAEEDMFIPDCFLDPSDPEGYTYLDYFAIGKYEMSGSNTQGYSKSGQTCLANITISNARKAARSYGDNSNYYNGYQLQDYSMTVLYNFLCMTYYKTANIQTVYGGRTSAVSSWSSASATGTTDPIEGLNGWNTVTDCVKMLGIENPYGNVSKYVDGIFLSAENVYLFRLPHLYGSTSTGAICFDYSKPMMSGFLAAFKPGSTLATKGYIYPVAVDGTADTYVGDKYFYSSNGSTLCVGGDWKVSSDAGLWYFTSYISTSTSSYVGARLAYRPC